MEATQTITNMLNKKSLTEFYPKLAKSDDVQKALQEELGDKTEQVVKLLLSGHELPEDLLCIHDLLYDLVHNEAQCVDSTSFEGSEAGEYEIEVLEYHGVFYVKAPQFDTIGYFETLDEANHAIEMNW